MRPILALLLLALGCSGDDQTCELHGDCPSGTLCDYRDGTCSLTPCGSDIDCGFAEQCDECASASCRVCDDCIAVCGPVF